MRTRETVPTRAFLSAPLWRVRSVAFALCAALFVSSATAGPDDTVFAGTVAITAGDIAWFRDSTVAWIHAETGSPVLLPPDTGLEAFWANFEAGARGTRFERVYLAFMLYADLPNGVHPVDAARLSGPFPVRMPETITVTADHRRLLARAWWREGFIDPKYPFGNYNYTEADIGFALGGAVPADDTGTFDLPADREAAYMALYHELPFVLAVWIAHAELAPGTYRLPYDGWMGYGRLAGLTGDRPRGLGLGPRAEPLARPPHGTGARCGGRGHRLDTHHRCLCGTRAPLIDRAQCQDPGRGDRTDE